MQKKLIALAVAGLISAPAMAQSNVQIYGVVDLGLEFSKMGDNKHRGVNQGLLSASRLGFRGTEDLGNGLKAMFVLEYGITPDTGNGPTGARQSFVGLDGGFGFVGLGRQYSPGHNILGTLDHFGGSTAFAPQLKVLGAAESSIQNAGAGRINNSINYKSKNFSGLAFEAMYAFGETNQVSNRSTGDIIGLGGSYKNGPIKAGLVYHQTERYSGSDDRKEWMLGGGYDFGVVDVNATYTQVKIDSVKNKVWYVNGKVPVSAAGSVLVGYSKLDHEDGDMDANVWTLAYTHSLSKRTTVYAGYSRVSNKDLSTAKVSPNVNTDIGENSTGLFVGVRHTF